MRGVVKQGEGRRRVWNLSWTLTDESVYNPKWSSNCQKAKSSVNRWNCKQITENAH